MHNKHDCFLFVGREIYFFKLYLVTYRLEIFFIMCSIEWSKKTLIFSLNS